MSRVATPDWSAMSAALAWVCAVELDGDDGVVLSVVNALIEGSTFWILLIIWSVNCEALRSLLRRRSAVSWIVNQWRVSFVLVKDGFDPDQVFLDVRSILEH